LVLQIHAGLLEWQTGEIHYQLLSHVTALSDKMEN